MTRNTIIKDALILFVITLIAGVLLGAVHVVTEGPIADAKAASAAKTYKNVMPLGERFTADSGLSAALNKGNSDDALHSFGKNVTLDDALYAYDANGEMIGYIIISSAKGYGGQVQVSTGIDNNGIITGIGFLTINETPGLGMKAKESAYTDQFQGMSDLSAIHSISGATKTSKAVNGAVTAAKYFFENYAEKEVNGNE